jgi:hypothetical protein
MSDETAPSWAIQLEKLVVESFRFLGPLSADSEPVAAPIFKIGRRWSFSGALDLVQIVFQIVLSETEDDDAATMCELSVRYDYSVTGITWVPNAEGTRAVLDIPTSLLETMFSVAYSTTRGILYEKARGTAIDSMLIPIVVPKDLIPENSALHHEKELE